VDSCNTLLDSWTRVTPCFPAPLALGADISMTSATKFIAGHSDVTGGILAVKGAELAKMVYFHQNAEGLHLGPFDCWLALRGLKTMVGVVFITHRLHAHTQYVLVDVVDCALYTD
jgi:cystathionine beta-lyase/cystathionine gamma-synthase